MNTIIIQQWNEEQFRENKTEWTRLLEISDADQLFLSWEWQYTWWHVFAKENHLELALLAAYTKNDELIGLAPLFLIHTRTKKLIKTTQLQFIGNICRGNATMRTEHVDFIVSKKNPECIKRAFLETINNNLVWDEFFFSDLSKSSTTYSLLVNEDILTKVYFRKTEEFKSYYLDTSKQFHDYISQRGKNTRLKMYNRRKLLELMGTVKITKATPNEIDEYFTILNILHGYRWGRNAYKNERLTFNATVAKLMSQKNSLNFSILSLNNIPISIQFNYIINKHEYNIQAGFKEDFNKKINLGYLHFGYAIENAFTKETLVYDFLAGGGKKTSYKEHLTSAFEIKVELQIIRKKALKLLYHTYDYLTKTTKC